LLGSGDFEAAGKALDAVATGLEDGTDDPLRASVHRDRAMLRLEQGRLADALADAERGLALALATAGPKGMPVAQVQVVRGEVLARLGKHDAARKALGEAASILEGNTSPVARPVAISLELARMQVALLEGSTANAKQAAESAHVKLAADESPGSLWALEETRLRRLAEAQRQAGEIVEACASLDAAIELRGANALPTDPRLAKAREQRARCTS
jgi:tetratricopeptide (TPR) repeat protein